MFRLKMYDKNKANTLYDTIFSINGTIIKILRVLFNYLLKPLVVNKNLSNQGSKYASSDRHYNKKPELF